MSDFSLIGCAHGDVQLYAGMSDLTRLPSRAKDLEGLAGQLKGFNLEEYLSGGTEEPDIPVAWAIGNDVLPSGARSVSGERAGMFGHSAALASAERVKVLFVTDYGQHSDNSAAMAKMQALLSHSMPGWNVVCRSSDGPFEDDDGLCAHLDGPTGKLKGDRQVKRVRVDLLTSCAKVLRNIGAFLPDFVIGIGQGGVIAGMLRFPLVVEVTLQARNLQRKEIREVVAGWAGTKAFWSVNPRLWKSKVGVDLLSAACPEISKAFPVDAVKGFGVVTRGPKEEEVRQIANLLSLGALRAVTDVQLASLAREPGREIWEHDGKCSCGKRAYVFGRCVSCIEKEAAEDVLQEAVSREARKERGIWPEKRSS